MNRRAFHRALSGYLLAAPLVAEARLQPRATFRGAMRELDYVEGRAVAFEAVQAATGRA